MRTSLVGAIATMTACASGLTEPSATPIESTAGVASPDERDVQEDITKALSFVRSGTPASQKRP